MGAYGVSVHVNLGNEHQSRMLGDLGRVADQCAKLNIPLLAMMYHRSYNSRGEVVQRQDPETLSHLCSVAAELGADFVKIPAPDPVSGLDEVTRRCPIPVLIAGGSKTSTEEILLVTKEATVAGASGVSFGRNVFQHEDAAGVLVSINGILKA
jgi:DhnA family fructose-bisphosphate aldolase class Ia